MRGARGFSLIEVMMAGAIFAIGLTAIYSAFRTAANQFEHQRHTTYAVHITEAVMEELLVRTSSDTDLTAGSAHGPRHYDRKGFVSATASTYKTTWEVKTNTPIPNVRQLTVTTSWTEKAAGQRSITFSTNRN
jgi:prepilin-type N-terminal cleavage/methylation domain-containing protein